MQDFEQLINGEKPILIDFYATWCEPCKWVEPVLNELEIKLSEKLNFAKIDIDQFPEIARQCTVMSVPTLMLFKQGEVAWRMAGFKYAAELQETLTPFL